MGLHLESRRGCFYQPIFGRHVHSQLIGVAADDLRGAGEGHRLPVPLQVHDIIRHLPQVAARGHQQGMLFLLHDAVNLAVDLRQGACEALADSPEKLLPPELVDEVLFFRIESEVCHRDFLRDRLAPVIEIEVEQGRHVPRPKLPVDGHVPEPRRIAFEHVHRNPRIRSDGRYAADDIEPLLRHIFPVLDKGLADPGQVPAHGAHRGMYSGLIIRAQTTSIHVKGIGVVPPDPAVEPPPTACLAQVVHHERATLRPVAVVRVSAEAELLDQAVVDSYDIHHQRGFGAFRVSSGGLRPDAHGRPVGLGRGPERIVLILELPPVRRKIPVVGNGGCAFLGKGRCYAVSFEGDHLRVGKIDSPLAIPFRVLVLERTLAPAFVIAAIVACEGSHPARSRVALARHIVPVVAESQGQEFLRIRLLPGRVVTRQTILGDVMFSIGKLLDNRRTPVDQRVERLQAIGIVGINGAVSGEVNVMYLGNHRPQPHQPVEPGLAEVEERPLPLDLRPGRHEDLLVVLIRRVASDAAGTPLDIIARKPLVVLQAPGNEGASRGTAPERAVPPPICLQALLDLVKRIRRQTIVRITGEHPPLTRKRKRRDCQRAGSQNRECVFREVFESELHIQLGLVFRQQDRVRDPQRSLFRVVEFQAGDLPEPRIALTDFALIQRILPEGHRQAADTDHGADIRELYAPFRPAHRPPPTLGRHEERDSVV